MLTLVRSLLTILWLWIRGKVSVTVVGTDNVYRCYIDLSAWSRSFKTVYIVCREHAHKVKYERWGLFNRTVYTYSVEIIRVNNIQYVDRHVGFYPLLCSRLIPNKTYPHRCAINAHIDVLIRENP